ncbi:MAG: ADP-ribosylglycohydrolase family protein [Acidobacteriaceae bacterium]
MNSDSRVIRRFSSVVVLLSFYVNLVSPVAQASEVRKDRLVISQSEYLDRVNAIWMGQMIGQLTGLRFEHKVASVLSDTPMVHGSGFALTDDDYYYEMVAIRAFEKHGINLTVEQLGDQWLENSAGSWGSSAEALGLLRQGMKAPDTGNPRYNKFWWTIGPEFSSDVYGTLAPGMPDVAAEMARRLTHVNGYAEGTDGAVFISGMISLGFVETDTKTIVRKAARLISPLSPYRQSLDMVISMADAGKSPEEISRVINERWGIEYPATNNAVLNGSIVAISVWFGAGDFSKTENLAFSVADYADTDCNAANAASVIGAMHGMAAMPANLVASFNDRVKGASMGGVPLTPPVDESILALGDRTAKIGEKILLAHGAKLEGNNLVITIQQPVTQAPELFKLSDFTKWWGPEWSLERAGFGGGAGGIRGIRGGTFLDGDILSVFPRDEVRGALLRRTVQLSASPSLDFDAGVDPGKTWHLQVYVDNDRVLDKSMEGPPTPQESVVQPRRPPVSEGAPSSEGAPPGTHIAGPPDTKAIDAARHWEHIHLDLSAYKNQSVVIRLYDLILVPGHVAGNSYWKRPQLQ